MSQRFTERRSFLKTTAAAAAVGAVPYFVTGSNVRADEQKATESNDRPLIGCIGTGSRWNAVGPNAMHLGDVVAVCDVDANHAAAAHKKVTDIQSKKGVERKVDIYEDYQKILERNDIEIVTIVTTDHWHSKIAIEAMKAGKDVYCEKPLTLTIDEGKKICQVAKETGRVFQVGTQQRSEMGLRFLQAVALVRSGRIGDVQNIAVAIGGAPTSGTIPVADIPNGLNWEKWLGQAPMVDYRWRMDGKFAKTRCHYEFRWWYEYSGGKLTDWGAHHVDIAQWAIGQSGEGMGATSIEPIYAKHPVELKDGMPVQDDQYNCATEFHVKATFDNGVVMDIKNSHQQELGFDNGIMFTGTEGRFLVNRGKLVGAPIDALKDNPLPENAIAEIYGGKNPAANNAHMTNFFECVKTRSLPISDVYTHHRALTTCHLSNIAIRLNRSLKWDPKSQQIVGDDQANAMQSREARKGYEVTV
ncbi:Gfo/Idh/MocA family oxidoreductase [Bremerella sp. JC817]|uniref:Gfo/Idh/MocA family protein n=1 Tax=Bremerella sp. JC817 TaxID=3231756 RepID=UPI003459B305